MLIYRKIFRTSLFLKEMARQFYPDFAAAVHVTGSLQADRLLAIDPRIPDILKLRGLDPGKQTVLIASSWGEHSLIQTSAELLLAQTKELARDYNIILTIHLNNYHAPLSGGKDWERELAALAGPGVYVTRPTESPYVLLHVADLMVTDMTSLWLYFTLFTRPIIFLDDPRIEYTPDALIPELKDSCYVTNDIANLSDKIRECLVTFEPEKFCTLNDKVFSHRGSARQRYREEILESLWLP
jgi:CDP-glycerol glycerophosphotransferase (TagB/SpsB family)